MFHIALYQPEIPPNTGNIIRLCANTNAHLHLIKPLGFSLDEKQCRRAGLDYLDKMQLTVHDNFNAFITTVNPTRLFACSTHGKKNYADVSYQANDCFLFGPETRGLPKALLHELPTDNVIKIPMQANNRSINLANAVSIILYEAFLTPLVLTFDRQMVVLLS